MDKPEEGPNNPREVLKKAKVEDDEYKNISGEKNYYSIAHTIKETVTQQATIMVNGLLKEYQVKVGQGGGGQEVEKRKGGRSKR